MRFIDLSTQYEHIKEDVDRRIQRVLAHGKFIMGPEVGELEERLADYIGVKHCIGVASGTDALLIALMALGVGRGDEVITTPFSFVASAETIVLSGARPVFVDINPRTYNIAHDLIEDAISDRTKALIPVSLYGQCAEFDAINAIANRHGIPVIEDGAQSFGASYKGRKSCSLSTIGCTSFFPSKPLGGYGDAGACFTDDDSLAKAMREIRIHGQDKRYHHARIGINGRLDTLQAAVLLAKLEVFPQEVEARASIGSRYSQLLNGAKCVTPYIEDYNESVYAQYTIQAENREHLAHSLEREEIPTAIHYPGTLDQQPGLQGFVSSANDLANSRAAAVRVLSLPMHPYLSNDQITAVARAVANHCR